MISVTNLARLMVDAYACNPDTEWCINTVLLAKPKADPELLDNIWQGVDAQARAVQKPEHETTCTICGRGYTGPIGSTPCCGALAEVVKPSGFTPLAGKPSSVLSDHEANVRLRATAAGWKLGRVPTVRGYYYEKDGHPRCEDGKVIWDVQELEDILDADEGRVKSPACANLNPSAVPLMVEALEQCAKLIKDMFSDGEMATLAANDAYEMASRALAAAKEGTV